MEMRSEDLAVTLLNLSAIAGVLSSYWITGLLMDDRWFVFTSRLRFGHTSPLAIGQRLDRETVDNAPLSCGDVQGETDC